MIQQKQKFSFERASLTHQKLIVEWLHKEHVKPYFFGQGLKNTLDNLDNQVKGEKTNFIGWISFYENKPLGYLMTSPVAIGKDKPYSSHHTHGEAITLDLLIGEEKFLGKGLCHQMIQAFILDKFPQVDRVFIDPALDNPKAIHVYKKAGFKPVEEFIPDWNPIPHLLLKLEINDISL